MDKAAENSRRTKRSTISQEGHSVESVKFGSEMRNKNRRALQDIKNFVGTQCMITRSKVTLGGKGPHGVVPHRPLTRSYAASLASKSQACDQETNAKLAPLCNETHKTPIAGAVSSDDSAATEVDHSKSASDLPVPMVDEVQEMVDCELHDFEMQELEEEDPIIDIDACDSKNPLAVVDYVEDIYSFYRNTEVQSCVSPDYMSDQFDINEKMRAILIDWLIEVHYKFELMEETLYLTVNIIDRFLAHNAMARKKLQLVGVTAMLLASKYEEISAPIVENLVLITDRTYTQTEIISMEKFMVNTLKFNMSVPTPYVFMKRFLKAAEADKELELVSFFFIELCLVEYKMLKFCPSMLAAAAVYTAQCTVRRFKHWTRTCELHSSYSEEQLQECSRMMVDLHENAGVGKLTAVHRKYSTNKFGRVARLEPALYMLEDRD